MPVYRFPKKVEVWDLDGNVVHEVADLPLADGVPIAFGSVRTGRRDVGWRADADATLHWTEALDGGDAGAEAEARDRVDLLPAPFDCLRVVVEDSKSTNLAGRTRFSRTRAEALDRPLMGR